jgi:tetratricopeptide (TPR) repeat protein
VQLTLGRLATASGDSVGAVAAFQKVLARQPADVEALLGLTDALLAAGKAGEAEEATRRALAASPSYWAVHNKLGIVLVSAGRVEEAVAAFRRAVELAPENARGLVNLGSALILAGRLDEAAAALRRSVAVEPTGEALSALGTVEYYLGRFDEAVARYEKAVAFSPGFPTMWVNLGDARRWSPSARDQAPAAYVRAIAAANEDLRINPRDVDAHLALASSYAKTGRPAQAAPHLAAVLAADPENPDVLYQAAVCEAVSGRIREAAALLLRAERHGAPSWQIKADPELGAVRASAEYREKPARVGGTKTEER